jgi:hypothetical protein
MMAQIVLTLIRLTGPEGQVIEINPQQVVSVRSPRSTEHFGPGVKCLISTADGKFTTVVEPCSKVRDLLVMTR